MAAKKELSLVQAKEMIYENLESIRSNLASCIDEGILGPDDDLYNQCLGLIDDIPVVENWDEMDELVARAKILEQDVAVWLSLQGRTSLSLAWPHRPN